MNSLVKNKIIILLLNFFIGLTTVDAAIIQNGNILTTDAVIDATAVSTIEAQLALGDVILTSLSGTDLNISADISWSSESRLTLQTDSNKSVLVNAIIENTNNTNGGVYFNSGEYNLVDFSINGLVKINNVFQLQWIDTAIAGKISTVLYSSGNYELASDINASVTKDWNSGDGFNPIHMFKGTLDGKNHTISGLYINRGGSDTIGLFKYIAYSSIKNLGLIDVDIRALQKVGALGGQASFSTITNVYSSGVIRAHRDLAKTGTLPIQEGIAAGGLLSRLSGSTLTNCYSTADVISTNAHFEGIGKTALGGLVAVVLDGNISHSYASGSISIVTPQGTTTNIGGLVGYYGGGTITQSYATGSVEGTYNIGGLIGLASLNSLTSCYATTTVVGTDNVGGLIGKNGYSSVVTDTFAYGKVTGSTNVSGSIGANDGNTPEVCLWDADSTGIADDTTAGTLAFYSSSVATTVVGSIFNMPSFSSFFTNFDTTWFAIQGNTRPILKSQYSTIITSAQQLQLMAMDLDADYVLGADIDLSASQHNNSDMWNTATGFVPVGDSVTPFTGTFDGAGYTISNMFIDRNDSFDIGTDIGLFGVTQGATIQNVNFVDANVTGLVRVGVVVGTAKSGTLIKNISASGMVRGVSEIGGLVGTLAMNSNLQQSYTTTQVSGNDEVGGLVGLIDRAIVSNTYARGAVDGNSSIGGLVGNILDGIVDSSYATGYVSALTSFGGLVGGTSTSTSVTNSFWDVNTSGETGSTFATGLSTTQMQELSTYLGAGWSILGTNGNYPIFDTVSTWSISSDAKLVPILDSTNSKIIGYKNSDSSGVDISSVVFDSSFTSTTIELLTDSNNIDYIEFTSDVLENIPTECTSLQAYSSLTENGYVYSSFKRSGCTLADDVSFTKDASFNPVVSVQIAPTSTQEQSEHNNASTVIISDIAMPINTTITIGAN